MSASYEETAQTKVGAGQRKKREQDGPGRKEVDCGQELAFERREPIHDRKDARVKVGLRLDQK